MKIQKPTIDRIVEFTAWRGVGERSGEVDRYAGIVVASPADGHDASTVDLVTFGPHSVYHNNAVPFDADGAAGTWRYPARTDDLIDV